MIGHAEGTLRFYHRQSFLDESDTQHPVMLNGKVVESLNSNFQKESYDMTDMTVSFKNITDVNQKYIAACGGGGGKIVVWKMQDCWLDLPSACISYEGKI